MYLFKLGILVGLLSIVLIRWHGWTAASDERARVLLECEQRGSGWVLLEGRCVAGSRRAR